MDYNLHYLKIFEVRLAVFLKDPKLLSHPLPCFMPRSDWMFVTVSCNVRNWSLTFVMPQERLSLTSDRTALDLLTFLIKNEDCPQKLRCDFVISGTYLLSSLCKYCCFWSFLNFIGVYRAQHNQKLPGHCKTKPSLLTTIFVLNLQR